MGSNSFVAIRIIVRSTFATISDAFVDERLDLALAPLKVKVS